MEQLENGSQQGLLVELDTMKAIASALTNLEPAAQKRVLWWVNSTFGGAALTSANMEPKAVQGATKFLPQVPAPVVAPAESQGQFETLAEFFAAVQPKTSASKVLAVGYWMQVCNGAAELESQSINFELKHLGHGVSNITDAMDSLINQRPQLMIQTRKEGTSRQARKKFKITVEGIRRVQEILNGGSPTSQGE